ncbi:MAG: glycosyltransferase family 2 protein [Bacilli bacterium]
MKLSVIIPSYNEQGNVKGLYDKLANALKEVKAYELIYVDDGSKDNTYQELVEVYNNDKKHVKVISFSRNFKKEAAIYAGLCHSSGEYTCIIDGDMQQNPKYLLTMMDFLDNNPDYEQVAMVMKKRKAEGLIMTACKNLFYKFIDAISDIHFQNGASDFRMFRRCVTNTIVNLSEKNRFSKGIFSWVGFNTKYMEYEVEPRLNGESKFNFSASLKYALDGIIGYSVKPLKLATTLGAISSLIAFIYGIIIIIQKIFFGIAISGYASLICVILFLGGIQLITIGILGEYLAKTYLECKNRPIYVIRKSFGFDDEDENIL